MQSCVEEEEPVCRTEWESSAGLPLGLVGESFNEEREPQEGILTCNILTGMER